MNRLIFKTRFLSNIPVFHKHLRFYSVKFPQKASKFDKPIAFVKPVRSQVRISKPIKPHKNYDTELVINKNLLKKFENDESEFQEDDEELYQKLVHKPEEFYDQYKKDERSQRELVKRKTIERKYFKKEKEPCLITWAAREQIIYLNNLDPDEWNPKHLSECFPITEEAVKKILKSSRKWSQNVSEHRKQMHDKVVVNNWKLLNEGKLPNVKPELLQLQLEGKLSPTLSLPNQNLPQIQPKVLLPKPEKPKGEFLSLISPYLKDTSPENKLQEPKHYNEKSLKILMTEDDFPKKNNYSRKRDVTSETFQETLKDEVKNYVKINVVNESISNPVEFKDADAKEDFQYVQKYKETVELTVDSDNAYLYNHETSYQHPVGKTDNETDKITIPKSKYKEGALYKVNNNFYSDDGEFLFKVPFLK